MKGFTSFPRLNPALAIAFLLLVSPVYGQISTLCTAAMLRSFSACVNYASNGVNGNLPTVECCDSLKSLMSSGRDCLCLIITGGVPFHVPINRTIAASLPRACKTDGVPIECKAMGSPLPAPGPTMNESGGPPQGSDPRSPWLPEPNVPTPPGSDGGDGSVLNPPGMTPDTDQFPMTPPGVRPDLSAARSSKSLSHFLLLALYGAIAFTYS